jgi:outer membrane lipoprotein-sorting protein
MSPGKTSNKQEKEPEMKPILRLVLAGSLALCSLAAFADMPKIDWSLEDAVRQIDQQAENFESAMARVDIGTKGADGTASGARTGDGFINEDGDMRFSQDGGKRVVVVDRKTVSDYDQSAATVTEYSLSKHKNRLEPYYRFGFSVPVREMQDRYLFTILGEEEVGEMRTLVFELTPTKDDERAVIAKIRLWIDQGSWMPRRQEFSLADRSVTTVDYTAVARNLRLNPDLFKDSWPRGTKKVKG